MLSLTLDGDWHSELPKGGGRHYYPLNEIMCLSLTEAPPAAGMRSRFLQAAPWSWVHGLDTAGRLSLLSLPLWAFPLFSEAPALSTMQLLDNLHYKLKALPSSFPSMFLLLEAAEIDSLPSLLLFFSTAIKLSLSFPRVCSQIN